MLNRRVARAIAIALVAILALTLLAGVLAASAATTPPAAGTRRRVLVIGDSVLDMATAELPRAMPERQVIVDAAVDRTTAAGVDVATRRSADADVVVVQLGTNDAGTIAIYRPRVERLLAALARVPLVIWLTIREVQPYYVAANDLLRDEVATHPNLAVADWGRVADQSPQVFSHDGLHLKGDGPRLMAAFVADEVARAAPGDGGHALAVATTAARPTARAVAERVAGNPHVDRPARGDHSTPWALVLAVAVAAVAALAIRLVRRPTESAG